MIVFCSVCLRRGSSMYDSYSAGVISFGSRVFNSLYLVLAMNTYQVGIAQKEETAKSKPNN